MHARTRLSASRRATTLAVVAAAMLAGCSTRPADADDPGRGALELFDLGRVCDGDDERLARLFGPGLGPEARAVLCDALARVPGGAETTLVGVERQVGSDAALAEVEARLAGGGAARYRVELAAPASGGWRIVWFQGPGVEWPAPAPIRGEALSTSPPPGADGIESR